MLKMALFLNFTLKKFAKKTEHPMSMNVTVPVTRCSITPKNLQLKKK